MHTVQLQHVPATPWRNRGGSTRELLAWPQAGAWQVRISVAQIDQDGDFSAYPGVERWFSVLAGAGVQLNFGPLTQTLLRGSAPLRFDGAGAPACTLIDGTTLDLNLMYQRSAGQAQMVAAAHQPWSCAAPLRACFSHTAARLLVDANPPLHLPAQCLVWDADSTGQAWALQPDSGPLQAWWMSFEPALTPT